MAAPKRSKLERAAQLPEIERLHNRGYSSHEIGARLGLSHVTILRDLAEVAERYRQEAVRQRTEGVGFLRAALREVRKEAWEAWEASKSDLERTVQEKFTQTIPAGLDGMSPQKAVEKMKAILTKEKRLPGGQYLALILKTFEMEADLEGFFAPTKVAPTTSDGTDLCTPLSDAERMAALSRLYARLGAADGEPTASGQVAADGSLSGRSGAGLERGGDDARSVAGDAAADPLEAGAAPLFPASG